MTPAGGVPLGTRIEFDPTVRQIRTDLMIGGVPRRMLRLGPSGIEALAELRLGTVRTANGAALARRLVDAGMAHPRPAPGQVPSVTVLIPVYDRVAELERCLSALGGQYPVVVVDDGSPDASALAQVAAAHGARLIRRDANGGPAAARNTGLAAISGELVAFLDSDCLPPAGWIDILARHLTDPAVAAVAPRIVAAPGAPAGARPALDLGTRPGRVAPGTPIAYVPTAALLARRSVLLGLRGRDVFDPALRYGEDVDLLWRLHAAGWRVRYEPAVHVEHLEPGTWRGILTRRFHYGSSAAALSTRHPDKLAPLILEPWSVAVLAALLTRRPVLAAFAFGGAVLDERRVRATAGIDVGAAGAVADRTVKTWRAGGTYATQFFAPVLLTGLRRRRTRFAAAALLLAGPAHSWWASRPPNYRVSFLVGHVSEDVAYGAGVVAGAARSRTLRPLLPVCARRGARGTLGVAHGRTLRMGNPWFETVAEAQRRAQRRLPRSVYKALIAGSERGLSLQDNLRAFSELGFAPHVAGGSAKREQGVRVMGQDLAMPVLISPTGVQAVHPDGEVAVARAAAGRGVAMGLSSFASKPIEDVCATGVPTFFQIYWSGTRDVLLGRLQRARAAGAVGIILTLDWSFSHQRDWGSPSIPQSIDLKTAVKFAPEVALRPQWLLAFARTGKLPDLGVPNIGPRGGPAPGFFEAYGEWMMTPPPSWEDVAWLRAQWDGPFLLKGICRVDDARRAVDAGVSAISVSNHGGNNLDGTPAAIRALPAVADAVGEQIEVVLDGGIRRGSDVVKALALGARAVMIGRAYLWGLAANGQAGVENVLDLLRAGIDSTMLATGKSDVSEFGRSDVLMPDGFARALGAD